MLPEHRYSRPGKVKQAEEAGVKMTAEILRLLIVDDNSNIRNSLRIAFDDFKDIEIVGEAQNGQQAVDLCAQVNPSIVLMDILMPEMDGIVATRIIRERFPVVKVVVLTSAPDETLIAAALQAGAASYLLKAISIDDIAATLHNVARLIA